MSGQGVSRTVLGSRDEGTVVLGASDDRLSSDGGRLVVREFDERIGLTARIAAALDTTRNPIFTRHKRHELVRQRLYGLLADDP
jgi:hypothetical protein